MRYCRRVSPRGGPAEGGDGPRVFDRAAECEAEAKSFVSGRWRRSPPARPPAAPTGAWRGLIPWQGRGSYMSVRACMSAITPEDPARIKKEALRRRESYDSPLG